MEEKKFYDACDTSLFYDMKLIGEEGIDLAILPIGDNYTMGPDDALRAVQFIQPAPGDFSRVQRLLVCLTLFRLQETVIMTDESLRIERVQTHHDIEDFIRFPFELYRGDSNWVPFLLSERRKFLDP